MCVVEIRAGQGGADAFGCAQALASAVRAWAARQDWQAAGYGPQGAVRTIRVQLPGVPAGQAG